MKCPYCQNSQTKVVDKREVDKLGVTRRRRQCISCGKRFTTHEVVEGVDLIIVKKDGRREHFSRDKLKSGMLKACEKRPVPHERITEIVDEIEGEIRKFDSTEIKSSDIGEMVIKKLKGLDKIAYIRFASVYREFEDISSFERELKELK